MTDAGLIATASTGELGSLPCPTTGIPWSAAADEIFEVEEKLTGRCVCHDTVVQVHRWLREKPIGEQTRSEGRDHDPGHHAAGDDGGSRR